MSRRRKPGQHLFQEGDIMVALMPCEPVLCVDCRYVTIDIIHRQYYWDSWIEY